MIIYGIFCSMVQWFSGSTVQKINGDEGMWKSGNEILFHSLKIAVTTHRHARRILYQ